MICLLPQFLFLATFDLQKEDVRKGSGTLNVTCVFARGSHAKGCHIVIRLMTYGQPHSASMEARRGELANGELEREVSTSFTDLEAGTYNVSIYDVGVNGEYNLEKSVYNEVIVLLEFSLLPTSSVTVMATVPPTGKKCLTHHMVLVACCWLKKKDSVPYYVLQAHGVLYSSPLVPL